MNLAQQQIQITASIAEYACKLGFPFSLAVEIFNALGFDHVMRRIQS